MDKHYSISKDDKFLYISNVFSGLDLYRVLPINVYTIDCFNTETLWGSLPSGFNDPFDSLGTVDLERLIPLVNSCYYSNKQLFDPIKEKEQAVNDTINNLLDAINVNRDCFLTTCFTPNINSEIMWAHYSQNGCGFALQYSPDDIIECAKEYIKGAFGTDDDTDAFKLSHVVYTDNVVDLTDTIETMLERLVQELTTNPEAPNFKEVFIADEDVFTSMLYRKSSCWSYEDEYRLTVLNHHKQKLDESPNYVCLGHCKPTAVYLGYNIKKEDEAILTRIANEKEIPIYKMVTKIRNAKYELSFDKIN